MKGWWQDAKKHPSPNSGYLEAATAYQLGIQLGALIHTRELFLIVHLWGLVKFHYRQTIY